jgi:hypothetical protein
MKHFCLHSKAFVSFIRRHFELLVWVGALVILFFLSEDSSQPSLCFFRFLGFTHCWGCGIGHSIHDALHLQFKESFHHHPLGIAAVIILLHRIFQLLFQSKQNLHDTQFTNTHPLS